jgi:hypothetical protein
MNPQDKTGLQGTLVAPGGGTGPTATQAGIGSVPPKLLWVSRSPSVFCGGLVLALVALGIGAVVFLFVPTRTPFYPQCAFHRLTGLNCPGCGATRAVYALLHGRWQAALHDNILFLLTALALGARAGWLGVRRLRRQPVGSLVPTSALIPWLVAAVIFGVLRNLPAFAFLSP